jgi:hypothetical protein
MGAPGSHQRTWDENDGGRSPHQSFYCRVEVRFPSSESIRKNHFQPTYAGANVGHPSTSYPGSNSTGEPHKVAFCFFALTIYP